MCLGLGEEVVAICRSRRGREPGDALSWSATPDAGEASQVRDQMIERTTTSEDRRGDPQAVGREEVVEIVASQRTRPVA